MTSIVQHHPKISEKFHLVDPVPEYLGHKIRIIVDELNGHIPWFLGSDVCNALGMKGGAHLIYRKLFDTEKSYRERGTVGMKPGKPVMVISETGFYKLIMRSNKPEAEAFQHWVCSEILPSIRKYGQYIAYADDQDNPIDVPEVMVEMVKLIEALPNNGGITETAPRMRVCDFIEVREIEGLRAYPSRQREPIFSSGGQDAPTARYSLYRV